MIKVETGHIDGMRRHAELTYPHECCGALLGRPGGRAGRRIARIAPLDNRLKDDSARRRFLISADDYRDLERAARAASLEIVGFYHSHPDHAARPSDFDREHALPWYSYVIIAVERGRSADVASWRLADDRSRFDQENIVEG